MANMCYAVLTVSGPKEDLERFIQEAKSPETDTDNHKEFGMVNPLSMDKLIPYEEVPEEIKQDIERKKKCNEDLFELQKKTHLEAFQLVTGQDGFEFMKKMGAEQDRLAALGIYQVKQWPLPENLPPETKLYQDMRKLFDQQRTKQKELWNEEVKGVLIANKLDEHIPKFTREYGSTSFMDTCWEEKVFTCGYLFVHTATPPAQNKAGEWEAVYGFSSKWSPPIGFTHKVSKKFPTLTFELSYGDTIYSGYAGGVTFMNGVEIEQEHQEGVFSPR